MTVKCILERVSIDKEHLLLYFDTVRDKTSQAYQNGDKTSSVLPKRMQITLKNVRLKHKNVEKKKLHNFIQQSVSFMCLFQLPEWPFKVGKKSEHVATSYILLFLKKRKTVIKP